MARDCRVLLIGDVRFRRSLDDLVDWGKLDLSVVGECGSVEEARKLLAMVKPQIALIHIDPEREDMLALPAALHESAGEMPIIMVTPVINMETLIRAVSAEVFDYLDEKATAAEYEFALSRAAERVNAGE